MAANITSTKPSKPNDGTAITSTAKAISLPRRAYVTFLAGNGDDVKGVTGLALGLRKVKSKYPLVVAVLPDVPEEHRKVLDDLECIVKEIEPAYPLESQTHLVMASHVSKLRIWQFVEYSKMIYLEGDVQVYSNIDDLFDVNDGYIYAPRFPWPDFLVWPTEFGTPKPSYYFNASMFIFVPRASIFDDLLKTIASIPPIPLAEQHVLIILLNKFFRKKLMGLPEHNYWALTMLQNHKENIDLDEVRVIHYCSPELKPWRFTPKGVNDIELVNKLRGKWLCIFGDKSLHPNKKQISLEMKTEIKRSREVAFRRIEISEGQKRVKEAVEQRPRKS